MRYPNDPVKRQQYLDYFKARSKPRAKAYKIKWASEPKNKLTLLLNGVRYRCKKAGVPFELTPEDLVIPTKCPYLGMDLTFSHGSGRLDSNISIDRIDSTKLYVKGNVQIISDKANRMKQNASIEELVRFAKGILEHHS